MNNPSTSGSPGRLPSFKGPRDLSLTAATSSSLSLTTPGPGHVASISSQAHSIPKPILIARPKRVFKPNIPPKRDKDVKDSSGNDPPLPNASQPVQSSNEAQPPSNPGSSRGSPRGERGGRGRGRGGNLIQSSSVFAEGVGDPLSTARITRSSRGRGGGGSRARGGGNSGSGRSRVSLQSTMSRDKLEDIVKMEITINTKTEPDLEVGNVVDGESQEESEEQSEEVNTFEPENEAVVLPLTNYLPRLRIGKKTPKFQPEMKKPKHISYNNDGVDFLSVTGKSRKKPVLCLFQFPSHLPVLLDQEKRQLASSLETLPEGRIGKMQFLADGRCRFVLENSQGGEKNIFDVEAGKPIGFRQDLASIDVEKAKLVELGPVKHKFVVTPDIDTLLLNMR